MGPGQWVRARGRTVRIFEKQGVPLAPTAGSAPCLDLCDEGATATGLWRSSFSLDLGKSPLPGKRGKREKTGSWQPLQDASAPGSRSRLGRNHPRLGVVSPTLFVFNRGTVPLNHRHIIISHYYFINVLLRVHFHFYWPGLAWPPSKMQSLLLKLKLRVFLL